MSTNTMYCTYNNVECSYYNIMITGELKSEEFNDLKKKNTKKKNMFIRSKDLLYIYRVYISII